MKDQINQFLSTLIFGAIAAATCTVAFLFGVIAVFLWVQQRYDMIVACGAACAMFLAVALICIISLAVAKNRAAKRKAREEAEAAAAAPSWLTDPAAVLTAVQIVRTIGFGKVIPLALAGLAAFGVMSARKPKTREAAATDDTRNAA